VHADLAVVHLHVLDEAAPVLQPLLHHAEADDKGQGSNHADGREGAHRGEREDGGEEEVEVGDAPELLEDGLGEEGDDVVLGGGDVVGDVLERLLQGGVVAVDDAREARPADGASPVGGRARVAGGVPVLLGAEAGEGVEIAPPHAVPPPAAGTAHLGARCPSAPDFPAMRMPALQRLGRSNPGRDSYAAGRIGPATWRDQFVISYQRIQKKKTEKKDGEIEQNARGNLTPGKPGIRKNNARITTACMEGTFTSEFTRVKRENSTKRTNVLSKKKNSATGSNEERKKKDGGEGNSQDQEPRRQHPAGEIETRHQPA